MTSFARYVLLTPSAKAPVRATETDAGLDVAADFLDAEGAPRAVFDGKRTHAPSALEMDGDVPVWTLAPLSRVIVPTGIAMQTSPDIYTRIAPRSGLAAKNGIQILGGVVDCTYAGEIGAILYNSDPEDSFGIRHGMRIAQLVLENLSLIQPGPTAALEESARGSGGFGSTGA